MTERKDILTSVSTTGRWEEKYIYPKKSIHKGKKMVLLGCLAG